MNPSDILKELKSLVETISGSPAYYMKGRGKGVAVLVPAKNVPEIKAFCALHTDSLGDVSILNSDSCYVPLGAFHPLTIISDIHPKEGVLTRGIL